VCTGFVGSVLSASSTVNTFIKNTNYITLRAGARRVVGVLCNKCRVLSSCRCVVLDGRGGGWWCWVLVPLAGGWWCGLGTDCVGVEWIVGTWNRS
jgi:hypothetical protein